MSKKVFQSMDGNQAAAYTSYAFTEVAGIYPITPSTPMAEYVDEWASKGQKNLFGMPVKVVEMQSEAGAAGSVHGSLQVGALTTTYTASQGLLLKIPNMYKIAGQLLPGVIHVAARALAAQSLAIFGDHQDVMACRQTGFAMLASGSVQEVMDLGGIAHLAAIKSSVPFLHFFDGFRTSHEVNRVEVMDYEVYKRLIDMDAVKKFRENSLSPLHPIIRGTAQNDDVYFQTRELQNSFYEAVPDIVNNYMEEISKETGRDYKPFTYYGAKDATDIIVAMGSVTEAIEETIDYLVSKGKKVGVMKVHLYRPFSEKYFLNVMPKTVKRIAVLDRTIEPGANGEPLYLDVKSLFYGKENAPFIIGGRYGLASKDTTPSQINAVFENLVGKAKDRFTIGINDDVTYSSLDVKETIDVADKETTELLFYGLGSDGTVGASKNTIKIIGDHTDLYGQAYASYDSKKSGGVTRMHLRFGKNPIRSTYLVNDPHFVSCSTDSYLTKYDMLKGLRQNGTFLLNTVCDASEIEHKLPNNVKRQLAQRNAKFYIINAVKLALECGFRAGLGVNTIMQSAFFKLNEQIMSYDDAQKYMKYMAEKTYAKKGQALVDQNFRAIEVGATGLVEVKVNPAWASLKDEAKDFDNTRPKFVSTVADVINSIEGDSLPVSAFKDWTDGRMLSGTAAYEKRGTAISVPVWMKDNCIQCNQCVFVCPHAVIRPFLADELEVKNAPAGTEFLKPVGKGFEGFQYTMQISTLDCTGCGVCLTVCPGKKDAGKALKMIPLQDAIDAKQAEQAKYFFDKVTYKKVEKNNAKNIGFAQPLFEFSGACGGCGETPYVKAVSQLFGERMIVANATGCTSIYSGSFPSSPYTTNALGQGPAWANSLFEDNAEFGFGMKMAYETMRDRLQTILASNKEALSKDVNELAEQWILNRTNGDFTLEIQPKLVQALEKDGSAAAKEALTLKDYIVKHSQWIIGGDGWGYDIGYGGLDHVIANKADVNILVIDTEVYSNTGGQSSKAARYGSIAKFTASGKENKKKDLAAIAMSYGHVYVAAISHGASQAQVIKALKEAEAYDGPSIIIAYAPCIAHGIKGGLANSQNQAKLATECGYWPTFRYDPRLEAEGKNPLQIDSKEPDWSKYNDFLLSETRYAQLTKINPTEAQALLDANLQDAKRRWAMYKRYLSMDYSIKVD